MLNRFDRCRIVSSLLCWLLFCFSLPSFAGSATPTRHGAAETQSVHRYDFISNLHQDTLFTAVPTSMINVGHGTVAWGDYDNDGQLDVLMTGITDREDTVWPNPSRHVSKIYRNNRGSFEDINAPLIGVNNNEGTIWCDYDHDGYLDLFIGGATVEPNANCVSKIYRYDGTDFTDINALIPGLVGTAAWGDVDGDGNIDLLITGSPDNGQTFMTKLYRNVGGQFVETATGLPGVWAASLAWGDYNKDGRPDLLMVGYGSWGVTSKVFRNDGPAGDTGWIFTDINASLASVNSGSVAWGDYDSDGNLDILLSGYLIGGAGGFTTIYKGDGTGNFVDVHPGLLGVGNSMVSWKDFDNDGDLDILVSGQTATGQLITKLYQNDSGVYTDIGAALVGVWYSAAAWGDYDNDGRLDLLVTGFSRSMGTYPWQPVTMLYHNNCQVKDSLPSTPIALTSSVNASSATLQWEKALSTITPQNMLTYNIILGSSPGGGDNVPALSDLRNGFHRVAREGNLSHRTTWTTPNLSPGTYYWRIQSIDNANAGSIFTPEQSFTIGSGPGVSTWQMVSLPCVFSDTRKTVVFPTASSSAYTYDDGGYEPMDVLQTGVGYWLRFPTSGFPTFSVGGILSSLTIPVAEGWNMIGSISTPIRVNTITSDPPGMVVSGFFGYSGGYSGADTILPGRAYWVKVGQTGTLTLNAGPLATPGALIHIVPTNDVPPAPPSIDGKQDVLPRQYALRAAYPNPFNPATLIQYDLPVESKVTVTVYNLLGQKVATLVDRYESAGTRIIEWRPTGCASGIYFYRLNAVGLTEEGSTFTQTMKVVFAK